MNWYVLFQFDDSEGTCFEPETCNKYQIKAEKKGTGFPLQLKFEDAERDEADQKNLPNSPCRSTRLFRDRDHGSLAPDKSPAVFPWSLSNGRLDFNLRRLGGRYPSTTEDFYPKY
jgi:hypothetical protein